MVDTGESGNEVKRCFCPGCGSPVFSIGKDGTHYVKGSTLGPDNFGDSVGFSIFTRNSPSWCEGVSGGKVFKGSMAS